MENLIKLKVDNSNIMSSLERATLKITSPTGKTIYLKKIKLFKATDEEVKIFRKFCGPDGEMIKFTGEMEATINEMNTLLQFSKL